MKYMGMQLKMKVPKPTYRETPVRLKQACCYREIFRDAITPKTEELQQQWVAWLSFVEHREKTNKQTNKPSFPPMLPFKPCLHWGIGAVRSFL